MLNMPFYLAAAFATGELSSITKDNAPQGGTIGFVIPSFSNNTGGLLYMLLLVVECFFFVSFILLPKKRLFGFQTQAVIFQGMFIGVDHVIASSFFGFGESLLFYIAVITAPIAAILSVNDKFKNLFICLINAYGTTYFLAIIFRFSYVVCIVSGVVLYFIFLLFCKSFPVLLSVIGKIITATLSSIAIIDVWGYISIMRSLHGASDSTTAFIISILVGSIIFIAVSLLVILPTYFQDWTNKKMEQIKQTTASGEAT